MALHRWEHPSPGSVDALKQNCLPALDDRDALVMAARIALGRPARSAGRVGYSEGHMRRRWERLKDMMLVPAGIRGNDDLLAGIWIMLHSGCCAAPAIRLLSTDARFLEPASG